MHRLQHTAKFAYKTATMRHAFSYILTPLQIKRRQRPSTGRTEKFWISLKRINGSKYNR